MPRKLSHPDPIAAYRREMTAQRRVGEDAECACGEKRPLALIRKGDSIMCAACARKAKGKTTADNHHVAAENNHTVTIPIPVNDHRAILSEAQYDWPRSTLENPHGSPMLGAAGCIRGFVNTVQYLLDEILMWIADLLEAADAYLTEVYGPRWWRQTPLVIFCKEERANAKS